MGLLIKIGEFFGMFNKAKIWLQGKKTYAINLGQVAIGLGAMLVLAGQFMDLVGKSVALVMGWSDGAQNATAMQESLKLLWTNHAMLAAGFSAAYYTVSDACSKMASYAAKRRAEIACQINPELIGPVQQ